MELVRKPTRIYWVEEHHPNRVPDHPFEINPARMTFVLWSVVNLDYK